MDRNATKRWSGNAHKCRKVCEGRGLYNIDRIKARPRGSARPARFAGVPTVTATAVAHLLSFA